MRVTNWGLFLLGVYLILAGLSSIGIFNFLYGLGQIASWIALIAGILLVMDTWRR